MREKFEPQFEGQRETEADEIEKISKKEEQVEAEVIENNPELTVDKKIIEDVMPEALKKAKEEHGVSWSLHIEDYIDSDKIRSIIYSQESSFKDIEQQRQELAKRTPLPTEKIMIIKVKNIFQEMPELFERMDLTPNDVNVKAEPEPPMEVEYDPNLSYSRYIDHSIAKPRSPDEPPKSYLQIGGKQLQVPATKLRNKATELGVKMSVADSLEIASRHAVAHEYAHILSEQCKPDDYMKEHPFFERAEKISKPVLPIDEKSSQNSIFSERFAQSMADQAIFEHLQKQGYEEDVIYALKKEVGGQDSKKLAQYQEIIEVGQKQGFSTSEVSDFLLSARIVMDRNGHKEEAEKIDYNWRAAGYYAPVFDKEQLQYIIGNTE